MFVEKLRKHKFFGLAIFDLVTSFIGVIILFLIAWKTYFQYLNIWKFIMAAIIVTIPISITFHILFGLNTQLNYTLGLSNKPGIK